MHVDEGQRGLTFEPDFDQVVEEVEEDEDIQIERDADFEDIRLREQEALHDEALHEPDVAPEPHAFEHRPLAIHEPEPERAEEPYFPPESPLVEQVEPEPVEPLELLEPLERHKPPLPPSREPRPVLFLPVAITLLLGLFVGFLAGYLVGAREGTVENQPAGIAGEGRSSAGAESPASRDQAQGADAGGEGAEATRGRVPPAVASSAAPGARRAAPPAVPPTREAAPAPTRSATRGRLVVRSTPPGALVYLNGTRRGSTPLSIRGLAPGTYTVRVARSGYRDQTERVSVGASGTRDISVRLQRPPAPPPASTGTQTGSIFVDSRPRGARVLLDGRAVGTTPVQLADIGAGTHVVRIELSGHRPWTTSARVVAGQAVRVAASLERQP
jgi:hypothetical protein